MPKINIPVIIGNYNFYLGVIRFSDVATVRMELMKMEKGLTNPSLSQFLNEKIK